jgi:hypothetical protein
MTKETFPNFPLFFQHCKGFNNTLGPLHQQAVILFEIIANQQKVFIQRYEGGIVGTHLAADHHHNVPARLQIDDESTGQKLIPVDGIFTVMNERHQVLAHRWTYSISNKEWGPLAQELRQRFDDQSQMDNPIIYLDKCCENATWFK